MLVITIILIALKGANQEHLAAPQTVSNTYAQSRTVSNTYAQSRTVSNTYTQPQTVSNTYTQSRTVSNTYTQSRTVSNTYSQSAMTQWCKITGNTSGAFELTCCAPCGTAQLLNSTVSIAFTLAFFHWLKRLCNKLYSVVTGGDSSWDLQRRSKCGGFHLVPPHKVCLSVCVRESGGGGGASCPTIQRLSQCVRGVGGGLTPPTTERLSQCVCVCVCVGGGTSSCPTMQRLSQCVCVCVCGGVTSPCPTIQRLSQYVCVCVGGGGHIILSHHTTSVSVCV